MDKKSRNDYLKDFFFPKLNLRYLLRLSFVAAVAFTFFRWILIPMSINGKSMEPTYQDGRFNFCKSWAYAFSPIKRGDVVMVRFSGNRVMLLKRVVAFEGETVEFRNGTLYINGKKQDEPYLVYACDWNLPPVEVKKGYVYVVGDNRNVPIDNHMFGQTPMRRIAGVPLW